MFSSELWILHPTANVFQRIVNSASNRESFALYGNNNNNNVVQDHMILVSFDHSVADIKNRN